MNKHLAWDDLRLVLAVAASGSLSGAGRRLGTSHATVFRRLGKVEQRLGARLFERAKTGYLPTTAGEAVAAAARRIEAEVLQVERRVAGQDLRPSGTLRATTTDTLLFGLLSPIFARFRGTFADISLEVAVANEVFDLSKREADVAVRPSPAPPESLVGRRIGTIAQAVYGAPDLVAALGDPPALGAAEWIGPDERMLYRPLERWLRAEGLEGRCRYAVDSVFGMLAAARDGAGLAVLPCYLADGDARLARVGETIPALATDLWLLTHPDLRKTARVRAFLDFVAAAVAERRDRLRGC